MNIHITSGFGTGKTLLSSFDAALQAVGVSNYNLIQLSSVIPPHAKIIKKKYTTSPEEYGHKLYVVKAEMRSDSNGEWIGAGVGWFQLPDGSGLFVEHEGKASSEEEMRKKLTEDITNSLQDLCMFRNYLVKDGDIHMKLSITQIKEKPTTVLVLAVYQSEGWN